MKREKGAKARKEATYSVARDNLSDPNEGSNFIFVWFNFEYFQGNSSKQVHTRKKVGFQVVEGKGEEE